MSKTYNKPGEAKPVGELTVLAAYFRKKDESLSEFSAQCKALSTEDKAELAEGAAKELGWTPAE